MRRTIAKARSGKQSSAAAEKEWEAFDAQLNAAYAEQAEGGTDERPVAAIADKPPVSATTDDSPVAAHEPDHATGDALVFSHNADATDVEAMPSMAVASPANPRQPDALSVGAGPHPERQPALREIRRPGQP